MTFKTGDYIRVYDWAISDLISNRYNDIFPNLNKYIYQTLIIEKDIKDYKILFKCNSLDGNFYVELYDDEIYHDLIYTRKIKFKKFLNEKI